MEQCAESIIHRVMWNMWKINPTKNSFHHNLLAHILKKTESVYTNFRFMEQCAVSIIHKVKYVENKSYKNYFSPKLVITLAHFLKKKKAVFVVKIFMLIHLDGKKYMKSIFYKP